jgi:UTP:GlnB (protein PII) uridylyltransferase
VAIDGRSRGASQRGRPDRAAEAFNIAPAIYISNTSSLEFNFVAFGREAAYAAGLLKGIHDVE